MAKARERNKPLTPEQYAEADKFLEHWAKVTKQHDDQARDDLYMLDGNGYMVRDPGPSITEQFVLEALASASTTRPPVKTGPKLVERPADTTSQKLEAQIKRQPSHRIKRLEYMERQEAIRAHGEELIERHGIRRVRPTVKVGHAHKKRR